MDMLYSMSNDPGIICFQHCDSNVKVFTFKFPDTCCLCHKNLADTELRIPPFRVPYPFRHASCELHSLVVKPTAGDFLINYENSSDLHIGVTDSKGYVYEFDADGKKKSSGETWDESLPIKIMESPRRSFRLYWDLILKEVFNQTQWTADRYNSDSHNCYTFVLTFLRFLQFEDLHPYLSDKTIFCEKFIAPQTRIAAKYISLYRQVRAHNVIVQ